MASLSLLTKVLADFLFGFYLLTLVLKKRNDIIHKYVVYHKKRDKKGIH